MGKDDRRGPSKNKFLSPDLLFLVFFSLLFFLQVHPCFFESGYPPFSGCLGFARGGNKTLFFLCACKGFLSIKPGKRDQQRLFLSAGPKRGCLNVGA